MLLTASVECGRYFKADRGTLTLTDGQLRFDSGGRCLFDAALSSIQVLWHWYSFGGAFEAAIAGKKYFLSFVPRGAGMDEWSAGMSTARQWRAVMEGRPVAEHPPVFQRVFVAFLRIAEIFILGCFTLLSLGVAVDPEATIMSRMLGGGGAVAAGAGFVLSIYQSAIVIRAALRAKK